MSEPISLGERRAVANGDCREWTPIECVRALLRDLEAGLLKPEQLCVHMLTPNGEGHRHKYYVAGMSFPQHIAMLEVAKQRAVSEWLE